MAHSGRPARPGGKDFDACARSKCLPICLCLLGLVSKISMNAPVMAMVCVQLHPCRQGALLTEGRADFGLPRPVSRTRFGQTSA